MYFKLHGGEAFLRLVYSTKRYLCKILNQARLTYEEILAAIIEVESVLNFRPLTYVSAGDLEEPLTPSYLMHERCILSLPYHLQEVDDDEADGQALKNRLNYLNRVLNSFWSRWRKEYLLELRESH